METITFHCRTVTPLVMNGAYGNNAPELRPPGIKASLRFWWRALNGHLSLTQLKEQEAVIFGSTKGRSKIIIRMDDDAIQYENTPLLEHRKGNDERETKKLQTWADSIARNQLFKIRIDCPNDKLEMIKNLFTLACTLGGWGKRSRRGFGSVAVTRIEINGSMVEDFKMPETIDDIYKLLDKRYFEKASNKISSSFGRDESYPYLKNIEVGSEETNLTQIGRATHDTMGKSEPGKTNYKYSIGAGSPRYASPIVISILPNHYPVVTTLKSVPPQITRRDRDNGAVVDVSIQNTLKDKIL